MAVLVFHESSTASRLPVDAEEIISLSVCLFFRPSRPREQTKTDDSFSGPRKDYGPERDPCKRRSDRRLVSHGIMLSDLSWDLWVNGSSPAAGLTRDVFGGGEDKNHEPIMLPLALFFSLSLLCLERQREAGR